MLSFKEYLVKESITSSEGDRESTIIADKKTKLSVEIYDVDDIINLKHDDKLIGEFGFDELKAFVSTVNDKLKKISYNR